MKRRKRGNTSYTMFIHNQYNKISWMSKYAGFKRRPCVFNAPIRMKRSDLFFNIKYKTKGMEHHTENSYYYFNDLYAGHRYVFIHGKGILDTKTDKYVKRFDDDPILGWATR